MTLKFLLATAASAVAARKLDVYRTTQDGCALPDARPSPPQRTFVSSAVDTEINQLQPKFKDPNLGQLFANAWPNSLDTTVYHHDPSAATVDSFIVTGDINAMWLRDSTNQVLPYLPYLKSDPALQTLIQGLIARQTRSVLLDPYANAFQLDSVHGDGPHTDDVTSRTAFAGTSISAMTPAIFERNWEVDSLANVLRLSYEYWQATGDVTPFVPSNTTVWHKGSGGGHRMSSTTVWLEAVELILATYASQQQDQDQEDANGGPQYTFQRQATEPTDTMQQGRGMPVRATGMIKTGFRGSDDSVTFGFNIPENAFASVNLAHASELLAAIGQPALAAQAQAMSTQVHDAIYAHGVVTHLTAGKIFAYEVDGFGNFILMDDANIPGLLSMPYYGFVNATDPLYLATRSAVLSTANPFFFNGTAAAGIGGPHNGRSWVWPMALIMQGWTAQSDAEISGLLDTLVGASACTGLVHESFDKNSFSVFTRPWFAWVNSLFGAFILKLAQERPQLIFN